jgi:hypothetical protein
MLRLNHAVVTPRRAYPQAGAGAVVIPGPGVAEPERGQEVEVGGVWSTIRGADSDQDVVRGGLGVFDDNVEIAVIVEDARVYQLILEGMAVALPIFSTSWL